MEKLGYSMPLLWANLKQRRPLITTTLITKLRLPNTTPNEPVGIGGQLGLEGLVLLVLGLDVGGFLVGLVGGGLQLLRDPSFDLVSVARELLQRLMLAQLGPLLDQRQLQLLPTIQHLKGKMRRFNVS